MLFHVKMDVAIPHDLDPAEALADLAAAALSLAGVRERTGRERATVIT